MGLSGVGGPISDRVTNPLDLIVGGVSESAVGGKDAVY
mgnify:CR=1 FL=1